MSRWRVLAGIGLALILTLGVGGWLLTRSHAASAAQSKDASVPPLVTVVVPALGKVDTTVSLTGLISARNDMPIGNEGDTSRIAEVLVEAGERVRQGQVLARLNPIAAESQVHSAEASLEEIESQRRRGRGRVGPGAAWRRPVLARGERASAHQRCDCRGQGQGGRGATR